jgi:hypothetical protein
LLPRFLSDQGGARETWTESKASNCFLSAVMNSCYKEVLKEATTAWRFQRLELVLEFSRRQTRPLPLNAPIGILSTVYMLLLAASAARWPPEKESNLDRLQRAFREEARREERRRDSRCPPAGRRDQWDFANMYANDTLMAALFFDLFAEHHLLSSLDLEPREGAEPSEDPRIRARADYVRDCAELAISRFRKWCALEQAVGGGHLDEPWPRAVDDRAPSPEVRD